MKDFLNFRNEIYASSYTDSDDEKRKNIENLYDFLVCGEGFEKSFKSSLIDLICQYLFNSPPYYSLELYFEGFSQNAVYDNFFIIMIKKNKLLIEQISAFVPREAADLTHIQLRSWLMLFQEIKPYGELIETTDILFEYSPDDEYALILQLKLLCFYLKENKLPVKESYFNFLTKAFDSSFQSRALRHYLNATSTLVEEIRPGLLKHTTCSTSEKLPQMDSLSSLMKRNISSFKREGILLFQFLFYGDPQFSGAGDSGGLAILLRDLGNAISTKSDIAGVITFCVYDTSLTEYPYVPIDSISEKHALVRLPLYLGGSGKEGFIPYQGIIESELNHLIRSLELKSLHSEPVFHIRYLDAASFILSRIANDLDIPLITTLTPDPHRRLIPGERDGVDENVLAEQVNDFYRVLIGDILLENSSGLIGIGEQSISSTLIPYFPQIIDKRDLVIEGIDEGIDVHIKPVDVNLTNILCRQDCEFFLEEENVQKPLILNVGRLNPAKGQVNLLKAWDEFDLWKTHNLVLIGGDFSHPSSVEKSVIDTIHQYIHKRSYLRGKIRFQRSTDNKQIRAIQNTIATAGMKSYPDIYLCSSIKEEFGISIIEAMSAGLFVMAPLLGGAKEYILQGINGFLINTESSESIGREFTSYIYGLGFSEMQVKTIQKNARQTIINKYSLDKIAEDFLQVYKRAGSGNER